MKILFPLGLFYPAQTGGPANTVYWLTKSLKKNSISPVIVTTNKDVNNPLLKSDEFLELDCGRVIYCKEVSYKLSLKVILNSLLSVKEVEIVHLTSLFYIPSFIILCWYLYQNGSVCQA